MATASGIRAGQAYVELFSDDSKLRQGLASAQARLKSFGETVAKLGGGLLAGGAAITAPLIAAAKVFAESGDKLDKMSIRTGVSVEMLSTLSHGANLAGSSIEDVEIGIKKMQKAIMDAGQGSKSAVAAFAELGLSARDLRTLSPDKQFEAIGEALAQIQDPALKTSLALELFGKSGTGLLPLASDLGTLREEIAKVGGPMSTRAAKSAAELDDAWTRLEKASKGIISAIGGAVAPVLKENAEFMTRAAVAAKKFISEHGDMVRLALKIGGALTVVGTGLVAFGGASMALSSAIGGIRTGLGLLQLLGNINFSATLAGAASLGGMLRTLAFSKMANEGTSFFGLLGKAFTSLSVKLAGGFKGLGPTISGAFSAAFSVISSGLGGLYGTLARFPAIAQAAFNLPFQLLQKLPGLISGAASAFDQFLSRTTIFTRAFAAVASAYSALSTAFASGGLLGVLSMLSAKIGALFTAIGTALSGVAVSVAAVVAIIAAAVAAVGYDIKLALDIRSAKKQIEETTRAVERMRAELTMRDSATGRGLAMDAKGAAEYVDDYIKQLIRAGKTREEVTAALAAQEAEQATRNETFSPAWTKNNAHSREYYEGARNESGLLRQAFADAQNTVLEGYEKLFHEVEHRAELFAEQQAIQIAEETGLIEKAITKRKEALAKFAEWKAQNARETAQKAAAFELEKLGETDPGAALRQTAEQYSAAMLDAAKKTSEAEKALNDALANPASDVRRNAQGEVEIGDNERVKKAVQAAEDAHKNAEEWGQSLRSEQSKFISSQERALDDEKSFYKALKERKRRTADTQENETFDARLRVAEARGSSGEGLAIRGEVEKDFREQIARADAARKAAEDAYKTAKRSGKKDDLQTAKDAAENSGKESDRVDTLRERLARVYESLAGGSFNRRFDVSGGFNASRVSSMAIGNTSEERQLKAAEEAAKYLKQIWQIQDSGGSLNFGV